MNRKGTAITISIFLMMIVLAVLLGFTAFYIDQVMIRPVVMMKDSERSLQCFFVLSNIIGTDYIREGEQLPGESLRADLLQTYDIKNSQEEVDLGVNQEEYEKSLNLMYKNSTLQLRNEEVFWTTVNVKKLPVECYMNVYGPVRVGTSGLFKQAAKDALSEGETINSVMNEWQKTLFPATED